MRRRLSLVLAGLAAAALFGGCGSGSGGAACYPTDWESCTCTDGARGYQQCVALGDDYGACDCSGVTPGAETPDAGDGGPIEAGTLAPYLANCKVNGDCESNVCFNFTSKGPHCTIACKADAECPAPSPGCSHMGICKAP
jgi:hypothetical protein